MFFMFHVSQNVLKNKGFDHGWKHGIGKPEYGNPKIRNLQIKKFSIKAKILWL